MPKRRIFVADHRPTAGEVYRYVRHVGLERHLAGAEPEALREYLERIGPRENIPAGRGRAAALRRANGDGS